MRDAVRLYLEDQRDDALIALHAASGVDPDNDRVWPRFPDGEDSVGIAQLYARLGRYDLTLLGLRPGVEQGYFCVSQFDGDQIFDAIRSDAGLRETMSSARRRHERAATIFSEEAGPQLLGVPD